MGVRELRGGIRGGSPTYIKKKERINLEMRTGQCGDGAGGKNFTGGRLMKVCGWTPGEERPFLYEAGEWKRN